MKVALTSAIYGGYDRPKQLPGDLELEAAFLFTDSEKTRQEAEEAGWTGILDPMEDLPTPMLRAKWWKTHPLSAAPGYDVSIWLDGSMTIVVGDFVQKCLQALGDDDISMTPHPERNCIYPEAELTASLARYGDCDPRRQVEHYRQMLSWPVNAGLMASGAATRRHNELVRQWGEFWWDECVNWTYQDQLSLPVITHIMAERGLRWNKNMPWFQWWHLTGHGY